ncbi:dTDP-4-dehydrorhamnose reductase [Shewanella psychrotolerans]|uniref:dTDP-4-dehydrorhamnose reductase n=1 Tax=Shewanella psychrotolerans TaxID=2864206 RepID=UPI001C65F452|nr:dTDP-4-dehydrorhamnose reductase [Shewanella psychrotolerans]QYK01305.1 dTDP-4-dehydrorhamnose reductase [Shewanella psychrotolerans]
MSIQATPPKLRTLVVGHNGQLAQALRTTIPMDVAAKFCGRNQLDIRSARKIDDLLQKQPFDLLINASGYTAVDAAESQISAAFDLNHRAVKHLAMNCEKRRIKLIHISSDYLFDGKQTRPYNVSDIPKPINVYGHSKLAGEQALFEYHPSNSTVVRSSWLYSPFGNNFVKTMLKLMMQQQQLNVIDDQFGSPTSAIELAHFIWQLAAQETLSPIYHWSDSGITSWFEFARQIELLGRTQGLITHPVTIVPVHSQKYPAAAQRPHFSALDCQLSHAIRAAKPWQENLSDVIQTLKQQAKEF